LKINLKLRLKNPVFLMTAVPATISFLYSTLAVFGVVPGISENEIVNILSTVISFLTTLGVLVDPTSKGICDSEDVLCKNSIEE